MKLLQAEFGSFFDKSDFIKINHVQCRVIKHIARVLVIKKKTDLTRFFVCVCVCLLVWGLLGGEGEGVSKLKSKVGVTMDMLRKTLLQRDDLVSMKWCI